MSTRLTSLLLGALLLLSGSALAQNAPKSFKNPILPGFHPDPSICRVGDDYYLVNSSFEWYPGLPVYHSKDLVNWELIGYGMHRPLQVEMPAGVGNSGGVFAPTIRHHEGTFYIINTCIGCKGNFYITATDPAGPWSDPVWLPDAPGIDPHLFWDEDGLCYYVGHGNLNKTQAWPDQQGVWMQQLDLETGQLTGQRKQLTHGHASNAVWTEGPHLFHIKGTYMLMVAEGGTDINHAVTFHVSDSLWGPYLPLQINPVITHRHLGLDYPVWAVGHADLVETQKGDWWSVMLAKRRHEGYTLLGRESWLAEVTWDEHEGIPVPVFNRGRGRLLEEQERPDLPWTPVPATPDQDHFEGESLALNWNFLRTPYTQWWELEGGRLHMDLRPEVADSLVNPSLIATRIEDHNFSAATRLDFQSRKENEVAGLILYRTSLNHYLLLKQGKEVVLEKVSMGTHHEIAREAFTGREVVLSAEARGAEVIFRFGATLNSLQQIGAVQSMGLLSDEEAWGFNGPYAGMYATSRGQESKARARFDWFFYKGMD